MIATCGRCCCELPIAGRQFLDPFHDETAGLIHLQVGCDYLPGADPVARQLMLLYREVIDLCLVCSAWYLAQEARTIALAIFKARGIPIPAEYAVAGGL